MEGRFLDVGKLYIETRTERARLVPIARQALKDGKPHPALNREIRHLGLFLLQLASWLNAEERRMADARPPAEEPNAFEKWLAEKPVGITTTKEPV
jgi:hypothetical protein